jgi:U-box domain
MLEIANDLISTGSRSVEEFTYDENPTEPMHTVLNNAGETIAVPNEFICPITFDVIRYPLVSRYGHVFERRAIVQWLEQDANANGKSHCPLTRQPLSSRDLQPHFSLLRAITTWQQKHKVYSPPGVASYDCNSIWGPGSPVVSNRTPNSTAYFSAWRVDQLEKFSRILDEYDHIVDQLDSSQRRVGRPAHSHNSHR